MKATKTLGRLALLALGAALCLAPPAGASNAIAAAEAAACTVCHDKPGSKLLTDRGKFYEATGTLAGYDQVTSTFGACTTCHVKKPGSAKLTKSGRRLALVFDDMAALKDWVMAGHPNLELPKEEGPSPGAAGDGSSKRGEETGAIAIERLLALVGAGRSPPGGG